MTRISLYYDIVSPYSYIAHLTIKRYLGYWNVTEYDLCPGFLGGVMNNAGSKAPIEVPNKGKWMWLDLARRKDYAGFDFKKPDPFPVLTLNVMRFLRQLKDAKPAALGPATDKFFHAFFSERDQKPINDTKQWPAILAGVLTESELEEIFEASNSDANKDRLRKEAAALVADGAFGMPWFKVERDDGKVEWFWGADRFDLVGHFLGKPWLGPFPDRETKL